MPPRYLDIPLSLLSLKTGLFLNKQDARRRFLGLYKAWYRQIPAIFYGYNFPVVPQQKQFKLRQLLFRNSRVDNVPAAETLTIQGQSELNEPEKKQNEESHNWKYLREEQKKSQDLWKYLRDEPRKPPDLMKSSIRVVWGAVIINAINFSVKTVAWLYTGSHSMFAESVHSLADTANQLILAVGIRKSLQSPTADHPYGYHPMRYIAPLISGVGIFCVGCGLSIYHGFEALHSGEPTIFNSHMWAYGILLFSFISESTTLYMAVGAIREGAKNSKLQIRDYIARNSDPGVIVVLLEDMAAVLGIGIAAGCMGLSTLFDTHVFDACGSLIIGSLLGGVATFIIKKNTVALVGKSVPRDALNNMNRIIEKDILIRAIHDVKAMDLGNGVVRYKAEVDVDGRELAKKYLEKVDLKMLLEDIKEIKSEREAEAFILAHGEGVIDMLGAEVDRIEKELRKNHPKVKHVDLEVL